jgi:hypothetical protein
MITFPKSCIQNNSALLAAIVLDVFPEANTHKLDIAVRKGLHQFRGPGRARAHITVAVGAPYMEVHHIYCARDADGRWKGLTSSANRLFRD